MTRTHREIHLASRPEGWPTPENFRLVEAPVPEPGDGEVLVRNLVMSVDPYMRGRMRDVESYVPPFALDAPLDGGAVGEVVESRSPDLAVGDLVLHGRGWRDYAVGPARAFRRIDPGAGVQPSAYLGVLGMPGFTAWVGLTEIAEMKEGDAVFVSGAAGAVGSIAGQIARLRGASRVIGSAGSPEKVAHLVEDLGFDVAFDYHAGPVAAQLTAAAPDGIDVYFDNVGGEHLEAAIGAFRTFGRAAICGAISQYNAESPQPGPDNLWYLVSKRLTLRGFIVGDHSRLMPQFVAEMSRWLAEGKVRFSETVVEGLENAPDAFIGLLRGQNTGKMVVQVGDRS
ncbi:MAG TPA: NADP-dependent oxidoreductase [Mycobacteriales bacterium]|nr:NADP-dependent oxidoreductase [Mycobacteriales bacterium]